jgi:hypothetical protein
MSFYEYDDCFVWRCDHCSRSAEFPPGNFWSCVAELKSRGWTFSRDDEGSWSHRCRNCQKSAAEILDMPLVGRKRTTSM